MWIAWPAFLVAGVMEMLVFALVNPQSLPGRALASLCLSVGLRVVDDQLEGCGVDDAHMALLDFHDAFFDEL